MRLRSFAFFILTLMTAAPPVTQAMEPKRVAVVIGVNNYPSTNLNPLLCAEDDARDLARELERHGFEVSLLTGSAKGAKQATRANVEDQLRTRSAGLQDDDLFVVGFFGHRMTFVDRPAAADGVESGDFLVPSDAIESDSKTMIDFDQLLLRPPESTKCRKIFFIDTSRGIPRSLEEVTPLTIGRIHPFPPNFAVFYGSRTGQHSYEDENKLRQGTFAYALVKSLRDFKPDGRPVPWADFVTQVTDNFNSLEVELAMPQTCVQDPILVGSIDDVDFLPGKQPGSKPTQQQSIRQLTGIWQGQLMDPSSNDRKMLSWKVFILQQGELISGFSFEESDSDKKLRHPFAAIEGRMGATGIVEFTKSYEGTAGSIADSTFRGFISEDTNSIGDGTWEGAAGAGGNFTLQRVDPAEVQPATGLWYGRYFYPGGRLNSVDFQMVAIQQKNRLTGFIREPSTFGSNNTAWLYAYVEGEVDNDSRRMTFTKKYDGTGGSTHTVEYSCKLDQSHRKLINGQWDLGGGKGTFVLQKFFP